MSTCVALLIWIVVLGRAALDFFVVATSAFGGVFRLNQGAAAFNTDYLGGMCHYSASSVNCSIHLDGSIQKKARNRRREMGKTIA